MMALPHDQDWEDLLRASLGPAPAPDFDAWRRRHRDAAAALTPPVPRPRGRRLMPTLAGRIPLTAPKLVAAALLVALGLLWLGANDQTVGPAAVASAIPGVDNVGTMTWTTTFYLRCTSEDGKQSCIKQERRLHAYRHPGQYRETFLDHNGQPIAVEITDLRAGRMLALDLKEKQAVLKTPPFPKEMNGPFVWVGELIRKNVSVSLRGQKSIDGAQANLVRAVSRGDAGRDEQPVDCFFDTDSKQLLGVWTNDEAGLEFDAELEESNIPLEQWYRQTGAGVLQHEIVLDARLTADDFSLDPPADFELEKRAKPTVSEDEMIAFLGAAARFNDGAFPPSPYQPFDSDKFNEESFKPAAERTKSAQTLIDIRNKIMFREIYQTPVLRFEKDQTVPESLYYVGAGVKVGQADKLVAWYRLRHGKQLRAVYGDLSVKNITDADLPLSPLSP